jgi:hypothetical protein
MKKVIVLMAAVFMIGLFTACKEYETCPAYKHQIEKINLTQKILHLFSVNNLFS